MKEIESFWEFKWELKQWISYPAIADYANNIFIGFSKNVSSKGRVKRWFFATFNMFSKHIFPENFVELPQVVQ